VWLGPLHFLRTTPDPKVPGANPFVYNPEWRLSMDTKKEIRDLFKERCAFCGRSFYDHYAKEFALGGCVDGLREFLKCVGDIVDVRKAGIRVGRGFDKFVAPHNRIHESLEQLKNGEVASTTEFLRDMRNHLEATL
jgi:hypothetical protein